MPTHPIGLRFGEAMNRRIVFEYYASRRVQTLLLVVSMIVLLAYPALATATTGDLDTTFGDTGSILDSSSAWQGLTEASDGKILAARVPGWQSESIIVRRYQSDGTIDKSWGDDGDAQVTISGSGRYLSNSCSVFLSAADSGAVFVLAEDYAFRSSAWVLARLDPTGNLDQGFGEGGVTHAQDLPFDGMTYDSPRSVKALDANAVALISSHGVHRFAANGSLDTSLDGDGRIETTRETMYAAWHGSHLYAQVYEARVSRFNQDLTVDAAFSSQVVGENVMSVPWPWPRWNIDDPQAAGSFEDSRGRSVFAMGDPDARWDTQFNVTRLEDDGSIDPTWGTNGKTATVLGPQHRGAQVRAARGQSSDRALVFGSRERWPTYTESWDGTSHTTTRDLIFTRQTSTGSLDPTFDDDGIRSVEGQDVDLGPSIILADGKVLASLGTGGSYGLARFCGDDSCTGVDPSNLGNPMTRATIFNDSMRGTDTRDTLNGRLGGDALDGKAGPDVLVGGLGNDSLNGGPGRDSLNGGNGKDILRGSAGQDTIRGGTGNDLIVGGTGRDTIYAGPGNDRVNVRDGHGGDLVYCGSGRDNVRADHGDRLYEC